VVRRRLLIDIVQAGGHHCDGFQIRARLEMLAAQNHLVHQHRIKAPDTLQNLLRQGLRILHQRAGDGFYREEVHIVAEGVCIQKYCFHSAVLNRILF
jgi:hypothetical protein